MSELATTRRVLDLLPGCEVDPQLVVSGLQTDSRKVREGDLFLAVPGPVTDGRIFIGAAIRAGAAAVLFEAGDGYAAADGSVPQVAVPHLGQLVGTIASRYYAHPSRDLRVIAVTGTNGKTSCTHYIAAVMSALGQRSAVIGTLGFGPVEAPADFGLTTPGALDMQRILHQLRGEGFRVVAVEASSHGLAQGRFSGTAVEVAVLTNLTRDHLDYHGGMAGYQAAKRILFELPGLALAVLNQDDAFGRELATDLSGATRVLTYSVEEPSADLHCSRMVFSGAGMSARIVTPWGEGTLESRLFGRFNLSNLMAVIAVLGGCGFSLDEILAAVARLQTVKGRMDRLAVPGRADVVIDYAHTPDALEQVLVALREHCAGELWCVFGCGGDRDRGKRPQMGAIAERLADHVVLTDDNPRGEASRAIIDDIMQGVAARERIHVEGDRAAAIRHAVANAKQGDVVLLAGKGHETYQEIGGVRRPFSDHAEVRGIIAALSGGAGSEVRT